MMDSTVLGSYFLTPAGERGMVLKGQAFQSFGCEFRTRLGGKRHLSVRAEDMADWEIFTSLNEWHAHCANFDIKRAWAQRGAGEFSR
jgi:hypothetical protein